MSCVDEIQEVPASSSNEILAAATREAAFLTDRERETILAVLTKDEQLRRQQQVKIMHLKAELQNLRRRGALKADWENAGPDPDRSCGRCRIELGRVINRGAYCRACRLKVCKGCREYNFRATDWVCTVCYKRMEIQAASGEWMNEFVRRPSRKRDTKVYVPAADIIKRTIRRSWTISNPTPRWASLRNSPELRPYNSLPRGQDINNYPSLALHQAQLRSTDTPIEAVKKSPTRRAKSEDVYTERNVETSSVNNTNGALSATDKQNDPTSQEHSPKRPTRINPLMSVSLRESKENRERRKSPRRKTESVAENKENSSKTVRIEKDDTTNESVPKDPDSPKPEENKEKPTERHVSFDNAKASDLFYFRSRSLSQSKSSKDVKKIPFSTRSLPEEGYMKDETSETGPENPIVELCDIEPLSGTVFRKMTVRRRRQENMRKMPAVDTDDVSLSEAHSSPMLASRTGSKSATPSPVAPSSRRKTASVSSQEWPTNDDDIDRLVAMHHNRSSLSSLGLRSDSMASVYSGAGDGRYGAVTVRGQVEFGLQYNYKAGALEIQIKQCKDLAPVDSKRNRSDPYVKVYLLPDKSKSGKRKTKVKKHTLNPVFDECLKFHMSLNELEIRTLWLSVWHSDMFGRNDFLGEVMMTLENKVFDDPTPKWYNLQERTEPFDDMLSFKGDIIVCLKFVPPDMTVHKKGKRSRGALHVLVKEAKLLTAVKANGSSDPFCKSYLLPEKGRSSKQKTPVVRKSVNPVWNHTFVYDDVTLQELAERSLELTVWDHDRLASNEFLGMVRFSLGTGKHYGKPVDWMDSTGKELNLWKSMLERPNFWVEGCLSLRSTLMGTKVT